MSHTCTKRPNLGQLLGERLVKQVLQHLRSGQIELADVPCPKVSPGHLLIQTTRSLISAGTERSLVEFSQAGLIGKARAQPDKVRQVLQKVKTDGLLPTLEVVFSRLDEPLPLGYCNVGRVVEVGAGVQGFSIGDRVASNGAHAEMVHVPATLAARIPDGVSDDEASLTVLGAIALHGVRLAEPTLGEDFVVVGLGLLGLIAAQLLRANGANVLGIDVNGERCKLAEKFGCRTLTVSEGTNPVVAATAFSQGRGVDGVIITASSKSDEIIHQATEMCRKRGRIVLVGVIGLNLRRADFYEKELSFQVSCSYGPGRYDSAYEQRVQDYPLPYVRWTVARNFEAILDAIAQKRLDAESLISKRIEQARPEDAYDIILNDNSALGVVLTYPDQPPPTNRVIRRPKAPTVSARPSRAGVGVIGAGNFTKLVLLPAIKETGIPIHAIASAGGVSAAHAGQKFEAAETATDYRAVIESPDVGTVFVSTTHHTHATMAAEALDAGKHVFIEKPLAIDHAGLELVREAHARHPDQLVMVGFNRRFAPHAVKAKQLLAGRAEPVAITMMVNAGDIPPDSWHHDPAVGGGRIIGEGCHFIDLILFLVGHPISSTSAVMFGPETGGIRDDKMTINMTFADGSIGTVHYLANGPKSYPKERVEIFSEGRVLVIDNWRQLESFGWPGAPKMKIRQEKGHKAEVATFIKRVTEGGAPPIPFADLEMVTEASFAAVRSATEGTTIKFGESK